MDVQQVRVVEPHFTARRLRTFGVLMVCGMVAGCATWFGTRAPIIGAMFPSVAVGFTLVYVLTMSSSATSTEARALNVFGIQVGSLVGYYATRYGAGASVSAVDVVLMFALAVLVSAIIGVLFTVVANQVIISAAIPVLFITEPFARLTSAHPTPLAVCLFVATGIAITYYLAREHGWARLAKPLGIWFAGAAIVLVPSTLLFANVMT